LCLKAWPSQCVSSAMGLGSTGHGSTDVVEYMVAGCGAAIVSRTCIAPVERVKIVFQTTKGSLPGGWPGIVPRIWHEEGFLAFWRGNTAAVTRVMPYLSVQLASNDVYRSLIDEGSGGALSTPVRNLIAGTLAGATAVSTTYPLDTVRARQAFRVDRSASEGMFAMVRRIFAEEGLVALYRGCWMSCIGGGAYGGLKFMTYDVLKAQFHQLVGVDSDHELRVWQRAVSGAAGGVIAQTLVYPVDVIRRRMQTAVGTTPYRSLWHGLMTIAREEGIRTGIYRGLSLNYIKTIPNVAIYLSLYDIFKYWLRGYRR